MLQFFRILIRLSLLGAHLMVGLLLAILFLNKPLKKLGLYQPQTLIRRWLYVTGYFTGCRICQTPAAIQSPSLILSNHVSWLDILMIGGLYGVHFLSKEDVKNWPIVGFLTVISGTLLIKRGSGAEGAISEIKQTLVAGGHVALFPEGTTTSGLSTRQFHSRLLKAAYESNSRINLISLSYSSNGKTRDQQMGWEQQTFFEHLFYVLGQKETHVKVNAVATIVDFKSMKRKALAAHCRQLIDDDLERNHYPSEKQHE